MHELINPPVSPVTAVRVLRCQKTQRYFTGNGWTENPADARLFSNEVEAVRACLAYGLHDVDLVLRMPGTGPELFATPIR